MCAISGFLDLARTMGPDELERVVRRMSDTMTHRGPDGEGAWTDASAGIALGHRRLAIIELTSAGAQPMQTASGRFVITYNGEIFNFLELRQELEAAGRRFRAGSDTEVLIEACETWGVMATTRRLIGMFAFAVWDRRERRLYLVRDRLGVKPLYWGRQGDLLFFASQPKAFSEHPAWRGEIDRNAIAACLRFNYIPAPLSVWKGVRKLKPGHLVEIDLHGDVRDTCYWDLPAIAAAGVADRAAWTETEAVDRLDALLRDSVKRRMISDVPLGAFLSGGIDSSTVVALMQAQSPRPIKTFTIGFEDATYNEAAHAKAVARHLKTEHTELYAEPDDALDLVPNIAEYYDEPFADASQLPTYLVSRLTRKAVTVSLSGDGGDEIFAGYTRYILHRRIVRTLGRIPQPMRRAIAAAILALPPPAWNAIFAALPASRRPRQPGDRIHKFAHMLDFNGPNDVYWRLIGLWDRIDRIVPGARAPDATGEMGEFDTAVPDFVERMQLFDELSYLPDDILAKVDRASMAVALEARVPLLDHRVVEFGWRLPFRMKLRDGGGKWLLRQVLYRYVPQKLVDRPKSGFAVPIETWLRGPLRDWAETLLDPRRLAEGGMFEPSPIRELWAQHLSGRRNWQYQLWGVLMIQAWRMRWGGLR
ncbi:MAG TPA: asparagine synthase (glutamine-hydrolyzing) [Candidatus Cybelea sp.]|nr:asparagine synthase (glutamine-hydrolyzing) [Candidatus Cybelea sp.]